MKMAAIAVSMALFVPYVASLDSPVPEQCTYLALQFTHVLEAPEAMVTRICEDRAAIEDAFPKVAGLWVHQKWEVGQIQCRLTETGWAEYLAGGLPALHLLLSQYSCAVRSTYPELRFLKIASARPLHSELLAEIFGELEGVQSSLADYNCCDGSTIDVLDLGDSSRYLYRTAWGDCPSGCINQHFRELEVVDGVPHLLAEWGDGVRTDRVTWSELKGRF